MSLPQYDIVDIRITAQDRDEHPAVVVSPNHVVQNPRVLKLNRSEERRVGKECRAGWSQFVLKRYDGLDFRSVADCSFYHVIRRDRISASLWRVRGERIS